MLNKTYLQKQSKEIIKKTFQKEGVVTLFEFFDETTLSTLQKECLKTKHTKEKDPLTHSYSKTTIKHKQLNSSELQKFLSSILKKRINNLSFHLLQFQHKDYIILHDKHKEKSGADVIIDMTSHWHESWGGVVIYTNKNNNYTQLSYAPNSITLIKKEKDTQKFVKYVNNLAGNRKRVLLIATCP